MKKNLLFISPVMLIIILLSVSCVASASDTPVNMIYIPSGYAMMGAEYGDLTAQTNAKPNHLVYLDDFYIDITEVTNADYAVCVLFTLKTNDNTNNVRFIAISSFYGFLFLVCRDPSRCERECRE